MKRKLFLLAISALSMCMMAACSSKDSSKEKESAEQVEAANSEEDDGEKDAPKTKDGVIAMLKAAYEDVNIIYNPPEDDCEPNIDLFGMYGSKAFNELIGQVREIEAKKNSEDDLFFTDWSALWHFWDEGIVTPTDFDVDVDGDTAMATFELVHGKDTATQAVSLVYEEGQWRVDDWLQRGMDGLSKVEEMKEYIKENK